MRKGAGPIGLALTNLMNNAYDNTNPSYDIMYDVPTAIMPDSPLTMMAIYSPTPDGIYSPYSGQLNGAYTVHGLKNNQQSFYSYSLFAAPINLEIEPQASDTSYDPPAAIWGTVSTPYDAWDLFLSASDSQALAMLTLWLQDELPVVGWEGYWT